MDNPFEVLTSGQADWDSDIIANFAVLDRGYHVTERAGQAVSTGQILSLNSGGFFFPYNASSTSVQPHAMAYTAAASGDSLTALAWGIVRSLGINSPAVPGQLMFSNASGFLATASLGLPVGYGLKGYGVLFNPAKLSGGISSAALAGLTDVNTNGVANGKLLGWSDTTSKWVPTAAGSTSHRVQSVQIAAVTNSTHLFTMSLGAGLFGWNRRVRVNGSSMSLVELRFYRDSGRSDLQYQTLSGGISAVTSFHDRAGWPIDTDSGTIYGSLQCFSMSVGSDTVNIIGDWEL